ncbi:hypothetical protein ACP4OV_020247 [Aristida adscensionis]
MRMPQSSRRRRRRNGKPRPPDERPAAAALRRKGSFQRRPLIVPCGEDRLSALADDLLRLILRRLDTRSALATAALSKRWVDLPRGLDALDFRVSDILPARYHRCVRVHSEASANFYGFVVSFKELCTSIRRYERRAMRAMAASTTNFLNADEVHDRAGEEGPRRVRTLRIEFFATQCGTSSVNRLIARSFDSWGVEDLEVSAKGTYGRREAYSFPHHGLCKDPQKSHLRSLKLAGCHIPPLQGFRTLSSLVLQDLPESTPTAAFVAVFTLCPQLQALHLKSCKFNQGVLAVHAPRSEIRQLVIEHCYGEIKLYTLPMLERMAVLDTIVVCRLSSFPSLRQLNVTQCHGIIKSRMFCFKLDLDLKLYLGGTPGITDLVMRYTEYDRWFKTWSPTLVLPKLKRLLIADVPSSWDVSWPRLLLEAAPCLERLHIHITPWEEERRNHISRQPPQFYHNQLKELVIVGFEGTKRQIYFVNFVMKVSTVLQIVSLYKNGHVQNRGHWDWNMVTQQFQWGNKEKFKILNQIADNVHCSSTAIQIVLG